MASFNGYKVRDRSGKLASEKSRMPKVGLARLKLRGEIDVRKGKDAARLIEARRANRIAKTMPL